MSVAISLLILGSLVVGCVLMYADIEQECRFQVRRRNGEDLSPLKGKGSS